MGAQGIAWRRSPNFNDRNTQFAGPAANTIVQGSMIQGQDGLQYVVTQTPQGQLFVPMNTPQGQPLLQMTGGVQQSYGNGMQPGYNQQGMMMQGGMHGGKMKKMKGGKHCGGKKHKKK